MRHDKGFTGRELWNGEIGAEVARNRFRRWAPAIALLVTLVLSGSRPAGQEPGTQRFRSGPLSQLALPCDLSALNQEYVAALNYQRQRRQPGAPPVRLDPHLLPGTFLHTYEMERRDSLYHDLTDFSFAEMCGSVVDLTPYRGQPQKLARYIWTRFHNSPAHDALQRDSTLRFVSVSCLNDFFVVRLSSRPRIPDKAQRLHFRRVLLPIQTYTDQRFPAQRR